MNTHTITDQNIQDAAESVATITRDMARTLDHAADALTKASNPADVHDLTDLMDQINRVQRIIQQTDHELAPDRLTRTAADLLR